jgi:hypothetical protein
LRDLNALDVEMRDILSLSFRQVRIRNNISLGNKFKDISAVKAVKAEGCEGYEGCEGCEGCEVVLRAYGYLELDKNQSTGFEPEVYEFTILCTSSNFQNKCA